MLEGGVCGKNGVVWLDDSSSHLGRRVDAELELALLAIVHGQTLHQKSSETRTSTASEGVENEETLKSRAVVGNTADLVQDLVNELLADSVVTTSIVVGSILLAGDHVLGVEKASVGAGADLIDDIGFQIAVDGSWNILSLAFRSIISVSVSPPMSITCCWSLPVSEKKVLKPWSSLAALRSSVK